jgi:hypothetical protein
MSTKQAVLTLRSRIATATLIRVEDLLEELLKQVREEAPDYMGMSEGRLDAEARPLFRAMAVMLIRAAAGRPRPEPATLAVLHERAQVLATQGFPLHALLQGYSVCMRVVWRYLVDELEKRARNPAVAAQATSDMTLAVVRLREMMTAEVADAYSSRERTLAKSGEALYNDVIEELLHAKERDREALVKRVGRMGHELGKRNAVAVFTIDGLEVLAPGLRDRAERILHGLPDAMRSLVLLAAEPLVEVRHRRVAGILESSLVAILPFDEEVSEPHLKAAIESAVGPLDMPTGCQMLIGLGRVENGVSGIAMSYQQAQRALEAAHATDSHTGVVTYTEALPTLILLRDPTLAQDSWIATVQPLLAHDTENGTQLVATLSAYLEERGVLAAAARRLLIHRHTLAARLEQIEELTGRSLRDRDDRLMLELGLRARLFADRGIAQKAAGQSSQGLVGR